MYALKVFGPRAVTMDLFDICIDRLNNKNILGDHLMAVIIVYGGNFGRNSRYRNEFPVTLRRTVTLSEFGSICPVNIGITQDSLSVRTLCCPDLWLSDSSALTFLFNIGLLFIY